MAYNLTAEVMELRSQGLTDSLISEELAKRGYQRDQIYQALSQSDNNDAAPRMNPAQGGFNQGFRPQQQQPQQQPTAEEGNIYERIEEIAENMIDEKWDELINEVKKIVEWKEKMEETQMRLAHDLDKLKEDFKFLHQGVLGKLEDYDTRMRDVGTELNAVGRVFKEVVPTFVENVKELSSITNKMKK